MIPPEARDELLGENETGDTTGTTPGETAQTVLLLESPGSLFPKQQKSFEHPLNQIVLSARTEDRVILNKQSIYVMSSKLDRKSESLRFNFDTKRQEIEGLLLSFNVRIGSGRLIITLNNHEVFNGFLKQGPSEPIQINPDLIGDKNVLEISVSGVPWYRFWGRNQYELRDLKLIASVKQKDTLEAITTFRLSKQEVDEFESGYLRFLVECATRGRAGVLRVYLNGRLISSSVPSCPGYEKIDLVQEDLFTGGNDIRFELSDGSLYLTNNVVKIQIKEPTWPVYYFEINSSVWETISDGDASVKLELEFVENDKENAALFIINGRKVYIETDETSYTKDITGYMREGSNYIRVIPEREMHLATLKVFVEE